MNKYFLWLCCFFPQDFNLRFKTGSKSKLYRSYTDAQFHCYRRQGLCVNNNDIRVYDLLQTAGQQKANFPGPPGLVLLGFSMALKLLWQNRFLVITYKDLWEYNFNNEFLATKGDFPGVIRGNAISFFYWEQRLFWYGLLYLLFK